MRTRFSRQQRQQWIHCFTPPEAQTREDPFTIYAGGEEARAKYGYLLKDLTIVPRLPSHDLESWEFYQLGENTRCTTRVEHMIWKSLNDRKLYSRSEGEMLLLLRGSTSDSPSIMNLPQYSQRRTLEGRRRVLNGAT